VNAAFIRRVLLDAQTVRFVIVFGEDEFTSLKTAHILTTLCGLDQLFKLEGVENQPLDKGMCVLTKENGLMAEIDEGIDDFPQQLKRWRTSDRERIAPMYHASVYHKNTTEHREKLLQMIGKLDPTRVISVNVNSLYPPESIRDLDRMYSRMFRDAYEKRKGISKTTVSVYEGEIAAWRQDDFWKSFEDIYFNDAYPSVGILRDISEASYRTSRDAFVEGHQADREAHILTLERMKKERIEAIKLETVHRSEQTVAAIKAEQGIEGVVPFDFANHPLYQERVCGLGVLESITQDRKEHEIARMAFAKWISRYNQTQLDQQIRNHIQSQIDALKQSQEQEAKALREVQQQMKDEVLQIQIHQQLSRPPKIVEGYEEIYRQFLKGKLVYKPNKDNDDGRKEFPIAALANPLEGTFDIRGCGDSAQYLQISTGFRTRKEPANENKIEVWIVPQFVLQKDPRAKAFNDFLQTQEKHRNKPFAILFTWGGWDNLRWHEVAGVDGKEHDTLCEVRRETAWELINVGCSEDIASLQSLCAQRWHPNLSA
jgi:hypothetical protein